MSFLINIRDDTHVGIGIWPFIINDPVFLPAAEWHDAAYVKGSWHQQHLTRYEVDRKFLDLMLICCEDEWDIERAWIYYDIVRAVGSLFWEGKE